MLAKRDPGKKLCYCTSFSSRPMVPKLGPNLSGKYSACDSRQQHTLENCACHSELALVQGLTLEQQYMFAILGWPSHAGSQKSKYK